MSEKVEGIVVSNSKAYGYNYASLSDIARQGFKIPKMKTGTEDGKEYVFYYDTDLKEWIRGAEIVVPEMKGSNSAQRYGASITYARRVTCQLALSLASADDEQLETKAPKSPSGIFDEPIVKNASLKDLADEFRTLYTQEEQERILKGLKCERAEDIGMVVLQKYINFKKYGKK